MNLPIPEEGLPLDDPNLYINRELSWLEFNQRVLEEARDSAVPLLDRLKFLAIVESNLDEFFMVRVGGLQQKVQADIAHGSGADRMPVRNQLEQIGTIVRDIVKDTYTCLNNDVFPALEKEGIVFKDLKSLTKEERIQLHGVFQKEIYPVLTPLAIDPGHPFPHLSNKSLNLAVLLKRPQHSEKLVAVVQVPSVLSRFVALPNPKDSTRKVFVPLEEVIRLHLPELFSGMTLLHDAAFRVTRNSDYEIDDDEVEDLLETIEQEVRKRRRGAAVRLQLEEEADEEIATFLMRLLSLAQKDVYRIPGFLDLTGLFQLHNLQGFSELREPLHVPQLVPEFTQASNPFAAIRAHDILLHHPYDSFNHVVDFIRAAAKDSRVLAIKQTLYRTSSDSPVVRALQEAADNDKQVTAILELKARLDEERNIAWARALEKAGVHVVYGFIGLKTHCKAALVVRREEDGIRRYVHLATGNYNPQTARIYTDIGFFTCKDEFCDDVSAMFNYLTGYTDLPTWQKIVIAPSRLKDFMIEKIDQERAFQQEGKEGRVIAKVNGVLEPTVIQALYRASQEGVKIDLICRGICALRPGIPGYSENIRVISIVDRFLEHSRIFYFGNGGDPEVYVGSADWMDRNLLRRVEVVFPIEEPVLKKRLIDEILATSLADNQKARVLMPDGSYQRATTKENEPLLRSQDRFLQIAEENARLTASQVQPPPTRVAKPANARRSRRRNS